MVLTPVGAAGAVPGLWSHVDELQPRVYGRCADLQRAEAGRAVSTRFACWTSERGPAAAGTKASLTGGAEPPKLGEQGGGVSRVCTIVLCRRGPTGLELRQTWLGEGQGGKLGRSVSAVLVPAGGVCLCWGQEETAHARSLAPAVPQ